MSESVEYASAQTVPPRNGMAVAAMVLGIIALVLSVVAIGGILGVVAVILGIVGVTRPGKKGQAVTGIVTGACALPVAFIALFFWVGFGVAMSAVPRARVRSAEANLSNLKTALEVFEVDNARYPTTGEGLALLTCPAPDLKKSWSGPYVMKVPLDPWGRPFVYRGPEATKSDKPEVLSVGPDGVEGTRDDVVLPARP